MSSLNIPNDYPVELIGPDISAYAPGNTGIPYVWSFEASAPGPHAMITAIVHGNEPCGALTLDWLLRRELRPAAGRLTLAFMNVAAYARFDPADANASRWVDEDMNRVWGAQVLASDRDSVELRRAREMQPVIASADFLLDIHSMQKPAPPVMLAGWLDKGVALARLVGVPELIVVDRGHAAGQHWDRASGALAREAAARFLTGLGLTGPELLDELGAGTPPAQTVYEVTEAVTITAERFTFAREFTGGEVIAEAGTLLGHDGAREVRTPYPDCLLVMPSKRLWKGQTAVRLARRRV
jgi:hypothetical protein